ncbi:hypothetical protein AQUCO_00600137v1 [Aquilegia coerulea]|uniref:NAD-dependent epimerase/dehydratase domain-containing protein n=1 Tax=Aquilegia coerulea TaxID=218851 RepID=A0A2G5EN44_AQUCA|nr:hypothetical protein AQUCO_00600137v1 [Aquilegia coerulea]
MELFLSTTTTTTTSSCLTWSWTNSLAPSSLFHTSKPQSIVVDMNKKKRFKVFCITKENQMTVSVTGATGFIGQRLVQRLHSDNHQVRVLTRSRSKAQLLFPVKDFPGLVIAEELEWKNCIQGSNAVVNLAGMPISTRWSSEIKKEIMKSRINVTSKVVDLINNSEDNVRPTVLVSATAVGYYGTSKTQVFDERSPSGNDYLAEVCREWEGSALKVDKDVRLALIRIGVVLGKDGGALAKMIPLFMMFAGGPLGTGKQWFSWIHLDDIVNLIYEALSNPSYKGVINGTAPNPVRLAEMCEHLGNVLGRPSWLPVPDFALKAVLGEGACVVSLCINYFNLILAFLSPINMKDNIWRQRTTFAEPTCSCSLLKNKQMASVERISKRTATFFCACYP